MEQTDKDKLLKYLCMALPHGVKCQFEDTIRVTDGESGPYYDYELNARYLGLFINHTNFYIKPYLRPLSSMTDEEDDTYRNLLGYEPTDFPNSEESLDFALKKHLDFMGLIPMDLAIEVTEDNPYKD